MLSVQPNFPSLHDPLLRAQQAGHRMLFIMEGSAHWCLQMQAHVLAHFPNGQVLVVSKHSADSAFISLPASKIAHRLGQECDVLVWDGFSGIDPDGLAISAGLIRAGGALILMLPPHTELFQHKDPDYVRMCADDVELEACSSHFLQRLFRVFRQAEDVVFLSEADLTGPTPIVRTPLRAGTDFMPMLPTPDQCDAIEAILALHANPASGVALLSAQRGRGKSSALGIACARLVSSGARVVLTAPSKSHAAIALLHFEREYTRLTAQPPTPDLLVFQAPDALLLTQPTCDLLVIDEAAMLPVPMLIQLTQLYPKCVFATTTDGYEGSGQGFLLKFCAALARHTPHWLQIELMQPIRWAEHDPLEQAMHTALMLNHSGWREPLWCESTGLEHVAFDWISQHQLAADEVLLQQFISLLTEAHYQTRPSDLRMLLDHPRLRLACFRKGKHLLAALVLVAEGGMEDEALAEGLLSATRRPRGHLVPQALTQFSGNPGWLGLKSWRVMRIAVRPECSRQRLGSRLLAQARQQAEIEGLDYLSTSFGLTEALLPFWLANQYQLLRIGYHRDAASACHSAHMVLSLTPCAATLANQVRQRFTFQFNRLHASHYVALDAELTAQVRRTLSETQVPELNAALLQRVGEAHRLVEDTLPELLALLDEDEIKAAIAQLSESDRNLLDLRINQGLSWQACARRLDLEGKKDAEKRFRKLLGRLLKC